MLTLKELHNKYLGAQDQGCDVPSERGWKHDGIVKETRTFTFHHHNGIIHFTISPKSHSKEAYTNFKISPLSAFDATMNQHLPIYISLYFEDHEIERCVLFKCLQTEPQFYQMSNGRAIPALPNCSNRVKIYTPEYKGPITISYDVVTSITEHTTTTEDNIYQEQFTGSESIGGSSNYHSIQCNFNHPIVKLYACVDVDDVEDIRITLDGEDHGLVMQKVGNHYEIDFGHNTSINFTRVKNVIVHIKTKNLHPIDTYLHLFGISKQVVRRMDGVAISGYYN